MNANELNATAIRLQFVADQNGTTSPKTVLSPNGGPSPELLAFCQENNLTLDYAILGEGAVHRKEPQKATLADAEEDATFLHGLLQGLEFLVGEAETTSSPASNAAYALASEVIVKCDKLLANISALAEAERRGVAQ